MKLKFIMNIATQNFFVMSSKYEALGLVTLESMYFGTPVIGFSDCPGTNEVIIDRYNGLLVSNIANGRALSLSLSKRELMSNEKLCQQLGQNANNYIKSRYSNSNVVNSWLNFLT